MIVTQDLFMDDQNKEQDVRLDQSEAEHARVRVDQGVMAERLDKLEKRLKVLEVEVRSFVRPAIEGS